MNTDSHAKTRLVRSFSYAIKGIISVIKSEANMKIHLLLSVAVIILGMFFSLSWQEWVFIAFAIGGMLSLEMVNTAIERVVDLVTKEYHPLAEQAKDIAAGAVLMYAVLSVVIGLIIFLPKILSLVK